VSKVEDLFAVPPKDFTSARNALAKELRDGGDAEEAKRVAALRRPTAALWAANQVSRRAPDAVGALLDASEQVRRFQATAVRGGGGDELRAAMSAQRSALARVEQIAAAALRDAGLGDSPATLRAIQSTVQAAATGDRDGRKRLESGTLEHELAPAGFETLLGAAPAAPRHERPLPKREPAARHDPAAAARERKRAQEERRRDERARKEEARQREQEARRKAREIAAAQSALRRLEERAQAAERAARAAREEAEAARARLERLRS
jgi:hypothetical protein